MRILVIGGTRGTGRLCVEKLVTRGDRVRFAARNIEKAQKLFGDRVEHVTVDLAHPDPTLKDCFDGIDHVIFTAAVPAGPAKGCRRNTCCRKGRAFSRTIRLYDDHRRSPPIRVHEVSELHQG